VAWIARESFCEASLMAAFVLTVFSFLVISILLSCALI
jgi:hypothetical protein